MGEDTRGAEGAIESAYHRAVAAILRERRTVDHESIRSLWRIGDAVLELKRQAEAGEWRRVLDECAEVVGMQSATLDDAARAAIAFPDEQREETLALFAQSNAPLTRSHIITLARATPALRARAIDALLEAALDGAEEDA
jgi:hypothetical protein